MSISLISYGNNGLSTDFITGPQIRSICISAASKDRFASEKQCDVAGFSAENMTIGIS
jgi:hypothetical protein